MEMMLCRHSYLTVKTASLQVPCRGLYSCVLTKPCGVGAGVIAPLKKQAKKETAGYKLKSSALYVILG